jgi:hypothetical protein
MIDSFGLGAEALMLQELLMTEGQFAFVKIRSLF